jgi:hypothetical protein
MNIKAIKHLRSAACLVSLAVTSGLAFAASPAQITIPGQGIFPESTTSGPDGSVYFGSIGLKKIFRAKPGADTAEEFVAAGTDHLESVFGVFADAKTNTLYACSGVPAFGPPQPGTTPQPAALHTFDLKTGKPKGSYPFPTAPSVCNDIAVATDGTIYTTDTVGNKVLRLKKGAKELEVWVDTDKFPPRTGLDGVSVLGNRVIVNGVSISKLFSIPVGSDGSAGAVAEITLDKEVKGPDGMRGFGKNSVLLIDGANGGELSKVTLTGNAGKVENLKTGFSDGPVAVTVVGTTAYVLEGQLSGMRQRPGAEAPPPKPFKATAVEVGKP